jgi:peptide/nickel transport system permease protein
MRFLRSSPLSALAVVILVAAVLAAILAPQIAPYDPRRNDYTAARHSPSFMHLLGTDSLGRDILSRIIYGLRISLLVNIASIALGVSAGVIWGITSA